MPATEDARASRSKAFQNACSQGLLDVAQRLHGAGASLDATDNYGWTPLHAACWHGHLNVAQWLHSAGASLDVTNRVGRTPLHYACDKGHLDIS